MILEEKRNKRFIFSENGLFGFKSFEKNRIKHSRINHFKILNLLFRTLTDRMKFNSRIYKKGLQTK